MSGRVRVGTVDELGPGERTIVEIDGEAVGVLNVEGDYYAIQNTCEHMGGPVCSGRVQGKLVAEFVEPGKRPEEDFSDDKTIACPWHGWEYELETGEHIGDDSISLETYDVVVEDGVVYVE
ncbi:Rieske (2Fe-2S) protein [Natrarchaeobius oligotrophus]|uniref:Rieske (2Fe-2S) protein n=1 Tax=Natrarchaeobius chitinivorans TaxID=1679083 RepID=A0A3N6MLI9_NATCH|nr:Rieske 2Fe-2S domain-containing protein [Natrarchaeobius chitinivorans]RQH02325.1 Rieske (2Fe-2S) protein [Natrarchaeobius chitinivorans]